MRKIDELNSFVDYLKGKSDSYYVNQRQEIISKVVKKVNEKVNTKETKIDNWKRYCKWCRENKLADTEENRERFRKSKLYIGEVDYKTVNGILRRYTEDQIESLHKEALQANHYSKYLFWRIKQINEKRKKS